MCEKENAVGFFLTKAITLFKKKVQTLLIII